jgi:hypothetical protein
VDAAFRAFVAVPHLQRLGWQPPLERGSSAGTGRDFDAFGRPHTIRPADGQARRTVQYKACANSDACRVATAAQTNAVTVSCTIAMASYG